MIEPSASQHQLAAAVRRELAELRGKNLGLCAACGQTVFGEQEFSRFRGRVVHVRCPLTARRLSPMALVNQAPNDPAPSPRAKRDEGAWAR